MIISHKYRFIFVKTPKTAGSSIETTLSPVCGPHDVLTHLTPPEPGHEPRNHLDVAATFRPVDPELAPPGTKEFRDTPLDLTRYDLVPVGALPHLPAWYLAAALPETWKSYFSFCVERNPWDKLVSSWFQHNGGPGFGSLTFEEYLAAGIALIGGSGHYTNATGEVIVDRVVRYENLEDELAAVLGPLGVPFEGLTSKAKSGHRPRGDNYRRHYTPGHRDLVAERFAKEIELFDYVF